MNTKLTVILAALAILTAGCDKSPTANNNANQPPPPVQAEPFHGQVYKSANGRNVLTLTSKDDCELMQDGTTLPCKYTKQTDALRVIATVMGTPQVIYFRFTDQGLQDNNGNVLFSPEKYAVIIEQQRQQAMIEQQKQLEAEKAEREKERVQNQIYQSTQKTQDIATFTLAQSRRRYEAGTEEATRGTLTVTDVSLIFTVQWNVRYNNIGWSDCNFVVPFGTIRNIGEVGVRTMPNSFILEDIRSGKEELTSADSTLINYNTDVPPSLYFNTESEARTAHDAIVNAFNAWKTKFPEAVLK